MVTKGPHFASKRSMVAVVALLCFALMFCALVQIVFHARIEVDATVRSPWEGDEQAKAIRVGLVKQEVLSWTPRIILFHNFLSAEECDFLMSVAKPRLEKSSVVDTNTGKGIESRVRTSSGMFLSPSESQHPIVRAIENRIATYSMVPAENGELLQVLRYENGQYYYPHHDFFSDEFNVKRGGQRVATMLMYLHEVDSGGETIFPEVENAECKCGGEMRKGLCIKPVRGDAVLFWSQNMDATVDPKSLHGSCSVQSGEKWCATKWMRQRGFG